MIVLDEDTVRKHLHMVDLIPAMRRALESLSNGAAVQPVRSTIPVPSGDGFLFTMPAYADGQLGAKLVTFFPNNAGIATHNAVIVLFSAETGAPMVVMDGGLVTEMRTGAASAAATQVLAREDASVLAIIGSGTQARSHLEALGLVRAFREVRVWSPHNARAFADTHGIRCAATAEEAVNGADVIVIATTSREPVLRGEWVSPGAHINAVGAARPDWRELDDAVVQHARIYVDSRDAAIVESGDVRASRGVFAEIGEVFSGAKPGRQSATEITVFKSLGVAVEDVVSARLVLDRLHQQ